MMSCRLAVARADEGRRALADEDDRLAPFLQARPAASSAPASAEQRDLGAHAPEVAALQLRFFHHALDREDLALAAFERVDDVQQLLLASA